MVTDVLEKPIKWYPEDGGDRFLLNTGYHLQGYTAPKPRRP
jgi:hypothetical protein